MNLVRMIYTTGLFTIFSSIYSPAQVFIGFQGGISKNYLLTTNIPQTFTTYNSSAGFSLGIPTKFQLNNWFAIQADPSFVQKNFQINRTDFFQGTYQKNINNYLQLPILANFSFGERKIVGFLDIGFYAAYWISSRIKGTEPNILNTSDTTTLNPSSIYNVDNKYDYDQKYQFSEKDNRLELGWVTGIGICYHLNPVQQIFLEGIYTISLTDQQKNYQLKQISRYNNTIDVHIGYLFLLHSIFRKR